jgi:inorganic pyrophosphatase
MPSQQQQQQPQHQHQQQPYQQPPQQYSGFSQQPYAASVQQPLSGAALAHAITSAAAAPAAPAGYDAYPPRDAYSGAGADSLHHRGGTGSPLLATSASSPKPTGAYALGHATGGSGSGGGYGGSFGSDGPGLSPAELSHSVSGAGSPKARHNPADARQARTETAESRQAFTVAVGSALALAAFTALWALVSLGTQSVYIVLTLAVVAASLLYILRLFRWALAHESYHPDMRPVAEAIKEGSEGYLSTQYSAIALVAAVVAAALAFLYLFRANPFASAVPTPMLAMCVSVSFLLGAACSAAAGYIGVWISVRVNVRVALAASRYSYADALLLCFRGGAISSALSAQLCILGVALLYLTANTVFAQWFGVPRMHVPTLLAGYGFGAAFVALFMQLGGGIYTKAADVGADMCGKIEAGIPEDDARNPAVIADLVGDNVGDCAGSMADVFESISAEVIGTMILGATLVHDAYGALPAVSGTLVAARTAEMEAVLNRFVFFPLAVHAVNLLVSCIGIESVRVPARAGQTDTAAQDPLVPMQTGYVVSSALAVALFSLLSYVMLDTPAAPGAWWRFALCGVVGLATSFLLIAVTQYYTDYKHEPVRRIAAASVTGHGTNVISGLSVGLESCLLPAVIIAAALLSSYGLGYTSGLPPVQAGIYGAAIATMGMLSTAVYVLSMNNFGPIADNAGGIVEMSEAPAAVRAITDRLDAVGNVTKAASKGYAVGGSALACFVLFQAYLDEIAILTKQVAVTVNLARVECICAGLLAIAMIFVFAGWSMEAVGKTAQQVVHEVRRQFAARPGIMDGSQRPDYARCVTIVTKAALAEMGKPAALALGAPVAVGFAARVLGAWTGQPNLAAEVLATFLMFGTLTGLLMAVFMDNAGGAWDNAKKYIESQGLKGSEQHKASVTGDTVGDPFKDTAGPSLHVIITTMSTTVLVLGPMFLGQIVDAAH